MISIKKTCFTDFSDREKELREGQGQDNTRLDMTELVWT